jgi:hypothetical protein
MVHAKQAFLFADEHLPKTASEGLHMSPLMAQYDAVAANKAPPMWAEAPGPQVRSLYSPAPEPACLGLLQFPNAAEHDYDLC